MRTKTQILGTHHTIIVDNSRLLTLTQKRPCVHSSCQRQGAIFVKNQFCAFSGILPKILSLTLTQKRPCVHSSCQRQGAIFVKNQFCAFSGILPKNLSMTLTQKRPCVHSNCQRQEAFANLVSKRGPPAYGIKNFAICDVTINELGAKRGSNAPGLVKNQ